MRKIKEFARLPVLVLLILSPMSFATDDITISELKQQLAVLKKRIEQLEKQQTANTQSLINSAKPPSKNITAKVKDTKALPASNPANKVKLYATVRPTLGYIDEDNTQQMDVRDALSHAGVKVTSEFDENWSATLHGEWGIDLSNNGDFGKARQVYVALNSPVGSLGIGKQRPANYLFIAEYVDIFNHASSPFAYDPESIFFVDNLLTYKYKHQNLTWMAAAQFNGEDGNNYSDLINFGASYDKGGLHAAATYLSQQANINNVDVGDDETYSAALAYDFDNGLYLAVGYQDKDYQRTNGDVDRSGHTFDLSAAYWLAKEYRLKLGYFDFSDGNSHDLSKDFNGFNTTLEWVPKPWLRFHVEYLQRDFDYLADFSSLSIGFRYDFSQQWQY